MNTASQTPLALPEGIDMPIGVAEYHLLRDLLQTLDKSLPNSADIEAELAVEVSALAALDPTNELGAHQP